MVRDDTNANVIILTGNYYEKNENNKKLAFSLLFVKYIFQRC